MKQKKNKGISLIVLIITIVVIIILAASIIINLSRSNIIGNANEAVFRNDVKSLKTELEIYVADKISDTLGKYDREKLNADESTGKYGEEDIEDKNKDGKKDIYDILSSLEGSRLKGKVYVEKGKLVFNRSGLTEEEKKILQDEGIEINGIPSITEITYESTLNSVTINVVVSDISEVEKYKYILDGGEVEESSEATKEYTGLSVETNYILEVIVVLKDGMEISKKKIVTTESINGKIEYILSETEPTINDVKVELKYEKEMPEGYVLQYKVGEGNWQEYIGEVTVTENTIVCGRLYNKELEDAKVESSINISNIDKDPPAEPVILSSYGYPMIRISGVKNDGTTTIIYDTREDITNLYSLDEGETWNKYTGPFYITEACTIIAKSVKSSGLESISTLEVKAPSDAITSAAYDGDDTTYMYTYGRTYYMLIDEEIWGQKFNIKGYRSGTNSSIRILDSKNKVLYSVDPGYGKHYNLDIEIPEGAYKLCTYGGDSYTTIKEISIISLVINITTFYPIITESYIGVQDPIVTIDYSDLAIQNLYKIDDGEWLEYKNEKIALPYESTIYAKSIFANGEESNTLTKKSTVPSNALGKEAYDGDKTTYVPGGDVKTVYIDVDESAWGKTIKLNYLDGYHQVYYRDINGNRIIPTQYSRDKIVTYTIPTDITRIELYFNEGGGIYEIELQ